SADGTLVWTRSARPSGNASLRAAMLRRFSRNSKRIMAWIRLSCATTYVNGYVGHELLASSKRHERRLCMLRHRLVVATAGHVDHGKTSVIQALTGTDCDRLAEEKARGITIDLGFAG